MLFKWLKKKTSSTNSPRDAYLSGIDSLIEQDTDRAIEELVKLAKLNPDTAETYLALGNLFRAKGDTERAIQVHRSLIHRTGIDKSLRLQAQFNLAFDFRKAGFIERAIDAFEELVSKNSDHIQSLEALIELYEESRQWEKAMAIQEKIAKLRKADSNNVVAHHLTELGKQCEAKGEDDAAVKSYKKAISKDQNCLDAYLHYGDLLLKQGKARKAIDIWKNVLDVQSDLGHLTYPRLEAAYRLIDKIDEFESLIEKMRREQKSNLYSRLALAKLRLDRGEIKKAAEELEEVLKAEPRFWEARLLLGKLIIDSGDESKAVAQYREILKILTPVESNFQCQRCGFEATELSWKCQRCRAWDTIALKPFLGESAMAEE